VTVVAVAAPADLVPPYDRPAATAWALALFTEVLGRPPAYSGGAWVWTEVAARASGVSFPAGTFARCSAPTTARAPMAVPDCVLDAARAS
jgi:hypothetical protein